MACKIVFEAHVYVSIDDDNNITGYEFCPYESLLEIIGPNDEALGPGDHGFDLTDEQIDIIEAQAVGAFTTLKDIACLLDGDGIITVEGASRD